MAKNICNIAKSNFISFFITDWVFKVPHEYDGCDLSEEECDRGSGFPKIHEFSRYVNAINEITVSCSEYDPEDPNDPKQLPDWGWQVKGR